LEEGAERIFLKKNFLRAGRGGRRGWKNYVKKTFSGAGRGGRRKILNSPQTHPPSGSHQKIQNGSFWMLHSWVLGPLKPEPT
jgi:hypothetical protein